MWFEETEGAKFWMQVLSASSSTAAFRDILICLRGRPEGVPGGDRGRPFRQTTVQTCIVHLIRNSLKYVPRREFAAVAARPEADLHRDRRRSRPLRSSSALMRSGANGSP